MTALTTRQRDLLQLLLDADQPLASNALAQRMHLTPRQVNYGLKGLKQWLETTHHIPLNITPGVGVQLDCSQQQAQLLSRQLDKQTPFQLTLLPEQRQQLLLLLLLDAQEPLINQQLQQLLEVSRTTISSDLDAVTPWLNQHGLTLERRPNYGISVVATGDNSREEHRRRQALGAWAWGHMPFGQPLTHLTHSDGLTFTMASDADLLPIVEKARQITAQWDVQRMFGHVAYAEAQLGGRFSDDAVLYLALFFAIQVARVDRGHFTTVAATETEPGDGSTSGSPENGLLHWLRQRPVWSVAEGLAGRLRWGVGKPWPEDEIAAIAMYLLAAPRNERWPGDLTIDHARGGSFSDLLERLMQHISNAYSLPTLEQDRTLQDGIIVQAVPAYLRQRFRLWIPDSRADATLSEKYKFEHRLANELARQIEDELGARLPPADVNNLALLLRAAYIRERAYQLNDVIVVCPSGMATAQLLVARLKARFPRLGEPRVLSIRDLTPQRVAIADLVITIEPLSSLQISEDHSGDRDNVIHVHPLLLPEDVEAITTWLASR